MEDTLTVIKLGLPEALRKSLATTNSIENLIGSIRRVSRNVKRWRGPNMIRRWAALGIVTAEKRFRRIKGYRHMGDLVRALKSKKNSLDTVADVA
jgi:transposase-like protein